MTGEAPDEFKGMLGELRARETEFAADREMHLEAARVATVKLAQVRSAIIDLSGGPDWAPAQGPRPLKVRGLILGYAATLNPGDKIVIEEVMGWGASRGWVSKSRDPHSAIQSALYRLANQPNSQVVHFRRNDYRKRGVGGPGT
jgi:hypothetical protein